MLTKILFFILYSSIACCGFLVRQRFDEKWSFTRSLLTTLTLTSFSMIAMLIFGSASITFVSEFETFLIAFVVIAVIKAGIAALLKEKDEEKNHIRGAALIDVDEAKKMLKSEKSRFEIGGVPVPVDLETRGFLFAGAPGTGKSQALTRALDALHDDNARAVVADASGIYCSRYFDSSRDIIINPFDQRGVDWSPLAEIETIADIPALAKSMIPDAEGSGAEWSGYAQTVLESILEYCFTSGLTNAAIFELAAIASVEKLREIFAGTPAAPLVAEGNDKMFGSVRAIVSSYLKGYQYLNPDAGVNGFSIRKHIVSERAGWLFLTYQQQHRDAQKSLIGAALDIAARAVLSLPPALERRVVFAIDELPLLGKVNCMIDLATNGRKHGSAIFAGIQTVAQVRESYGREGSQTLLSCLGSWLVLRTPDTETSDYMSRFLGEEEKRRIVKSGSTSDGNESKNWSEQIVKDRAVLPSELQSLSDLAGYFNLAGPVPAARIKIEIAEQRKARAVAFVAAPPRQRQQQPQQQPQEPEIDKTKNDGSETVIDFA